MRHKRAGKKLNRSTNHRRALIKNLVQQLVFHEKLLTTEAKAKVIVSRVEKMIHKAMGASLHVQRVLAAQLFDPAIVDKLVKEIAPRFAGQPGGYITKVRSYRRLGDNTVMVRLEIGKGTKVDQTAPVSA